MDLSIAQIASTLVLAWFVWTILNGLYNLYWHPLAKYPGPKLAAFTLWWKIYCELFSKENPVDIVARLHEVYGDIVRIAPNELHFSNPSAFHDIHNARNRWTKDRLLYDAFAEAESSFSLCDYRKAKARKDILYPLFSRKSIVDMQYLVQDCVSTALFMSLVASSNTPFKIDQMCATMCAQYEQGKSTNILRALRCLSLDAIMSFCFAKSLNTLKEPDFCAPVEHSMTLALPMVTWIKYIPFIKTFTVHCPPATIEFLRPQMAGLTSFHLFVKDQVDEVTKNPEALQKAPHPVIYHALLSSAHGQKISNMSLRDEALLLVFAGTDTASTTLTVGLIHVLNNTAVHRKLTAEIMEFWPNLELKPRFEDVERLPYLGAVLKEALRFAGGPLSPMTRIVPRGGAEISGKHIPGGTVVGISTRFVHMNESIFRDAHSFDPERWLGPGAENLEHWLVAFSRGPRSCLGTNLAWCKMYLTFANLFRRFELQLDGIGQVTICASRKTTSLTTSGAVLQCTDLYPMLFLRALGATVDDTVRCSVDLFAEDRDGLEKASSGS
ncbi:hypothetical protein NM688_g265 [Phlebia brevispora]|uniref:Uncharacterized protein n=1 Tax=Phlebia brevispora TaxID=194682 RepID=A0ACC1TEQ2_9APHY|nr:hypothetical protein NM688_g265 [Phlebia brevispora]